ncbi:MAG: PAS domain-containing protein [Desulfobulbaceae bacterium]
MEDEDKSREELLAELHGLREQLDSIKQQLNGAASEKAADQFKDLVQLAPIAMALSDSNGNVEYLNSKFSETFGYIHEDIPTLEAWRTRAYPDEAYRCRVVAAWNQALAKATKEGGPIPVMPYKVACKNGEVRTVEISGALIAGKCLVIFNDITERAKAEAALQEIEAKFRLFLEHTPIYVFIKDENIRSLHLSRNYEKMLGRPLHELLGRSMEELFPSELARVMVEDDRRLLRDGKPLEVEEEFAGHFYSTLKFPIYIDGKPRYLAGFTTDITERKIAEKKLRESEERFKSAFDHAAIGMALVGQDGRFLKVNPSLCRIVGYSEEELLALTFQELTYPADLDADLALSAKLFANEIAAYQMEKRYIHKNSSILWILLSGSLVRDANGAVLYCIAQIQDITERKRIEEQLRQQIKRYDLVVAGARDGIWDWDVLNKRVFFSDHWKAMRGYSVEEVGESEEEWSESVHPEDAPRVFARLQNHFDGKTPWFSEEYRVRCKDGSWKWILDRGIALRDGDGRVVRMAGSETDITERKKMEEERTQLIAELREALEKIKTLRGILPICASCKKIRNDEGYWQQIEVYIRDHSDAEFSHGLCPECVKKLYPDLDDEL